VAVNHLVGGSSPSRGAKFLKAHLKWAFFIMKPTWPFCVYILQSETTERYYCGQTNNIELRLKEHNDPNYQGTKTTKRFEGPWKLIWSQDCVNRSEAIILERSVKGRGIKRFLQDKKN
jgi:putative endonuclease